MGTARVKEEEEAADSTLIAKEDLKILAKLIKRAKQGQNSDKVLTMMLPMGHYTHYH